MNGQCDTCRFWYAARFQCRRHAPEFPATSFCDGCGDWERIPESSDAVFPQAGQRPSPSVVTISLVQYDANWLEDVMWNTPWGVEGRATPAARIYRMLKDNGGQHTPGKGVTQP